MDYYNKYTSNRYCVPCSSSGRELCVCSGKYWSSGPQGIPDRKGLKGPGERPARTPQGPKGEQGCPGPAGPRGMAHSGPQGPQGVRRWVPKETKVLWVLRGLGESWTMGPEGDTGPVGPKDLPVQQVQLD